MFHSSPVRSWSKCSCCPWSSFYFQAAIFIYLHQPNSNVNCLSSHFLYLLRWFSGVRSRGELLLPGKETLSLPFCWMKSCKVFVGAFPAILLSHKQFNFFFPHVEQNFGSLSPQLVQKLSSFFTWFLQPPHTSTTASSIISI